MPEVVGTEKNAADAENRGLSRPRRWTLSIFEILVRLITITHGRIYIRNTRTPIVELAQADEADPVGIERQLRTWIKHKKAEAQYVQVAGAVIFASVNGCLQWNNLEGRHWIGPAFWYASILLSLFAVVLGAQQVLVLDPLEDNENTDWLRVRKRLMVDPPLGALQPRLKMLYVWQEPLMCLGYAVVFFVGGLMSHVYSPIAQGRAWNDDAKVCCLTRRL